MATRMNTIVVSQPLVNGAFNCVQAVVSKGMDHNDRIQKLSELDFLALLESYELKNKTIDIDKVDDEDVKAEEEFFHVMAGCVNRLGIWCLEIIGNVEKLLGADRAPLF